MTPPEYYPLKIFYYLEYPPETSDVEGILDYTKNIASYVFKPASTFLVFAWYVEAYSQLLATYMERFCIRTEATYVRLVQ